MSVHAAGFTSSSRPVVAKPLPPPAHSCQQPVSRRYSNRYGHSIHRNIPTWPGNPAQHGGAHQQQQLRLHRLAAAKGESPKTAAGAALQPGLLVAFKKDERTELGLVLQPDGKKNFWIANEAGRRTSLPPKNVVLVLPGSAYTPESLQQFSAAAAAADSSLLEIAWAVAAEEPLGTNYSLSQLSQLLFDTDAPLEQYATFSMLLADQIYFKSAYKGGVWSYQPRDAAAVEQAAAEAAAEAAEVAARQAFLQDWTAAAGAAAAQRPASTTEQQQQWLAGPHKDRVQALLDFVTRPAGKSSKPSEAIARDSLALLKRRPEPEAAVVALQEVGLLRLHEPVPLLRLGHNAEGDFAPKLEQAAQALISSPPVDPDAARRVDLTHLAVFTIDDASTRDYDDGISVEQAAGGQLLLWVHVADPTRYLRPGDVLDAEACRRTRSLYFAFGSVPMFPRCLAEGPFSLGADASSNSSSSSSSSSSSNGVCDALSVCVTLREDGALGELVQLCPSRVRVTHRLTYDQVDADLGLGPGLCQHEDLQRAFEAARLRRAWRVSQGCIDIDLPEAKLEVDMDQLDASAPTITCTKLSQWESAARMLVAEMMILAGEAVAQLGAAASLPLPFRGQEAPQLPPEAVLSALPDGPCKGFALRKCMTRSVVSPQPVRHASLALDAYVQVTSPIRRYTDIIAHFNLKAHLRGETPPFSASDISQLMAAAGEVSRDLGSAERDVERYWVAEYMRQHWQRQQQQLRRQRLQQQQEPAGLPAMVLGWVRPELNLAAVTLEELGLENVIKVDFPVEPGDRLLLQVVEVDVPTGHYRLTVADRLDDNRSASSIVVTEELVAEEGEEGEADEEEEFAAGAAVEQ